MCRPLLIGMLPFVVSRLGAQMDDPYVFQTLPLRANDVAFDPGSGRVLVIVSERDPGPHAGSLVWVAPDTGVVETRGVAHGLHNPVRELRYLWRDGSGDGSNITLEDVRSLHRSGSPGTSFSWILSRTSAALNHERFTPPLAA